MMYFEHIPALDTVTSNMILVEAARFFFFTFLDISYQKAAIRTSKTGSKFSVGQDDDQKKDKVEPEGANQAFLPGKMGEEDSSW